VYRGNGVSSQSFNVFCGVRKGGVLSPFLFNIYVDDLITRLESVDADCNVCGIFFGSIMYADDLLLLSALVTGLQRLLDMCNEFAVSNDLTYNHKKSVCIKIGPHWNSPIEPMSLGKDCLDWVNSFKYLGILFNSGFNIKS